MGMEQIHNKLGCIFVLHNEVLTESSSFLQTHVDFKDD